jgi:type II secretory pathway pseudopilin PulG
MTLPEMTVVIAITALMVGLTIPAVNMLLNSFESQSGAKSTINAALSSARAIAAKEQHYAGIRFQKRYDPANPDPINESQYIIFIIQDPNIMAFGFKAVEGIQPIKLPDSIGVMDLVYDPNDLITPGDGQVNSDSEIANANVLTDTTTFSIIFSPSGKLVIHKVRTRNRDGFTATSNTQYSDDDIFNRISQIEAGFGMFLQDDYYKDYSGSPVINLGLGPEFSRNSLVIYETKTLKQTNPNRRWTDYLNRLKPVFINPYTGTIVNEK